MKTRAHSINATENATELDIELDQVVSTCACFNLRKASRVVTQHFDEILKPSGLLVTQFTILAAVAIVKSATINELAEDLSDGSHNLDPKS